MRNKALALILTSIGLLIGSHSLIISAIKEPRSFYDSDSSIPVQITIESDNSEDSSSSSSSSSGHVKSKSSSIINVVAPNQYEAVFEGSDVLGIQPSKFTIENKNKKSRLRVKSIQAVLKDPEWKFYQSDSIRDVYDHFRTLPLNSKEIFIGLDHSSGFKPLTSEKMDPGISVYPALDDSINKFDLNLFIYLGGTSKPLALDLVDLIFEFETEPLINDKISDELCKPYINKNRGAINPCSGTCASKPYTEPCFNRGCGDTFCGPEGKSCCYNGPCTSVQRCDTYKEATLRTYSKDNDSSTIKLDPSIIAIDNDVFANHPEIKTIINPTGRSFDWGRITGSTVDSSQVFDTGIIKHQFGDIRVIRG